MKQNLWRNVSEPPPKNGGSSESNRGFNVVLAIKVAGEHILTADRLSQKQGRFLIAGLCNNTMQALIIKWMAGEKCCYFSFSQSTIIRSLAEWMVADGTCIILITHIKETTWATPILKNTDKRTIRYDKILEVQANPTSNIFTELKMLPNDCEWIAPLPPQHFSIWNFLLLLNLSCCTMQPSPLKTLAITSMETFAHLQMLAFSTSMLLSIKSNL